MSALGITEALDCWGLDSQNNELRMMVLLQVEMARPAPMPATKLPASGRVFVSDGPAASSLVQQGVISAQHCAPPTATLSK